MQEVSLRLIKLSEEDKDLRDQVLSARKQLLDCSSNLILNAKHPFKALDYFQTLIQVVVRIILACKLEH